MIFVIKSFIQRINIMAVNYLYLSVSKVGSKISRYSGFQNIDILTRARIQSLEVDVYVRISIMQKYFILLLVSFSFISWTAVIKPFSCSTH